MYSPILLSVKVKVLKLLGPFRDELGMPVKLLRSSFISYKLKLRFCQDTSKNSSNTSYFENEKKFVWGRKAEFLFLMKCIKYQTKPNHGMVCVFFQRPTCRFPHPSNNPSSIALIPLPLKSMICKWVSPRNSVVENMGFRVSPSKLSANRNSTKVDLRLCSNLSVNLLKEFPERSMLRSGSSEEENI